MTRSITLNDGKKIPGVAWGNGTAGIQKSGQKAIDLGKYALSSGVLHIDTAQIYGTEEETGGAIKAAGLSKDDVWVTTKIGKPQKTKEDIRKSVESSISSLGFIPDLILMHNPYIAETGQIGFFWSTLEELVEDGTLKGCSLGVSNFRVQDLEDVLEVAKIKPAVNQLEYHPYVLSHLEPVLALQAKHKIVTESYGPLTPLLRHPTGGPIKPILTKIAQRLSKETGKTVDEQQVLLLWTVQKGVVAVTTSSKEENIKKLKAVYDLPDLTKEEIDEIEETGKKVHFRHYAEHMTKDFPNPDLPKDL